MTRKRRATPERSVQVALLRWLRLVLPDGSLVAAIKNEEAPHSADPLARARFQMARKATGTLVGMPDLLCVLPRGRVIFIEVKAPDCGLLSLAQQGVHERFASLGHPVVLATSLETARHGLHQLGIPLREAAGQATAVARVRVAKPRNAMPKDRLPA